MASIANVDGGRRVSTGRVFERAFATIRHNPAVTLGLALVVGALPAVAVNYFTLTTQAVMIEPGNPFGRFTAGFIGFAAFGWAIGVLLNALVQAVLVRATAAESEGRTASFGECIRAALAVLLPLVGLGLVIAIGVMFGFMLLFVPGVILYIIWSVASPALVEERRGVFGSLSRSAALTKGERWKIFGILLILLILYYMLTAVVGIFGLSAMRMATFGSSIPIAMVIGMVLISTVVNLVWGTVQASLYIELRGAKDGPGTDRLEEVFG